MDFDELIYGLNQTVFALARSVRYNDASPSRRSEAVEWASYVVTAGDEIIESILCSTVDMTSTISALRSKYTRASRVSKRVNPSCSTSMFDVYVIVLDELADFIFREEARQRGR